MRFRLAFAAAFALATSAVAAPAAHAEMSLFKSCGGKAAVGAGAGAVLGGIVAGKGAKTEGAILGAALGGLGTYGVCKHMDKNDGKKIDNAYRVAAANNQAYSTSWNGNGGQDVIYVAKPKKDGASCRIMNATFTPANGYAQNLPQETYCKGGDGIWRAV